MQNLQENLLNKASRRKRGKYTQKTGKKSKPKCQVKPYNKRKYKSQKRKGPPVPAKTCKNKTMKGNDKRLYVSEIRKSGKKRKIPPYYRWYLV